MSVRGIVASWRHIAESLHGRQLRHDAFRATADKRPKTSSVIRGTPASDQSPTSGQSRSEISDS